MCRQSRANTFQTVAAALVLSACTSSNTPTNVHSTPRCFDVASGINISQVLSLVNAASEACREQILRELCLRIESTSHHTAGCAANHIATPPHVQTLPSSMTIKQSLVFQKVSRLRVAFLVLAYGAIGNMKRLMGRLMAPEHFFLVHLDKKASWRRADEVRQWAESKPTSLRLQVMPERFDVRRGGASFLLVLLRGLEILFMTKEAGDWEYFVNLNDNDYPIGTIDRFQTYLALHRSETFVHVGSPSFAPCPNNSTTCRKIDHLIIAVECTHESGIYSMLPADDEIHYWFDHSIPIWAGPNVVSLWRPIAAQLLSDLHQSTSVANAILRQLRTAQQPDERFFQTFMVHGAGALGRHSHLPSTFHMWDGTRLDPGEPLQRHGDPIQIYSPPLLESLSNISSLQEASYFSPSTHFARKFDSRRTAGLQRLLDRHAQAVLVPVWRALDPSHGWGLGILGPMTRMLGATLAEDVGPWFRRTKSNDTLFTWTLLKSPQYGLKLVEKLAMAPTFSRDLAGSRARESGLDAEIKAQHVGLVRFVLAIRVGIGWDAESFDFNGPVSVIPMSASHELVAVAYLRAGSHSGAKIFVQWLTPWAAVWHEELVQVEAGSPIAWTRCPRAPQHVGRWKLAFSWHHADVHTHFRAHHRSECHGSDSSCKNIRLPHAHPLFNVSVTRPFEIYTDPDQLISQCGETCLHKYWHVDVDVATETSTPT